MTPRRLILILALLAATPAHADRRDHDALRGALERGEVRPLAEILDQVRSQLPGEIVGVEAERKHGQWVYEFRVTDKSGRLYDVYVDGRSGAILRTMEK